MTIVSDSPSINISTTPGAVQRQVSSSEQDRNSQASSTAASSAVREDTPDISVAQAAAEARQEAQRSIGALKSVTESIEEAVEVLNEALSKKLTSASIRRDEELNRYLVTIKDKDSGEVVREIPDEALLKFARNLQELKGILFDRTL